MPPGSFRDNDETQAVKEWISSNVTNDRGSDIDWEEHEVKRSKPNIPKPAQTNVVMDRKYRVPESCAASSGSLRRVWQPFPANMETLNPINP